MLFQTCSHCLGHPVHDSQIGFRKGSRPSDHIFTLRTVLNELMTWYGLAQTGIGIDLYYKMECAIKIDQKHISFFEYQKGLRQGCRMNPILFDLYEQTGVFIEYNKLRPN